MFRDLKLALRQDGEHSEHLFFHPDLKTLKFQAAF